jgi:pyruvate/2-oxoglutarate dehydrogenase complex dihydrolipoamide dehydrogenase (E3) component
VTYSTNGQENTSVFDCILVATGRQPNVEGLGCEKAGVKFNELGIEVNKNLRTSNKNIFACGDCVPGPKFTHNSDVQARIVIRNSLFRMSEDVNNYLIPYATFTDPEIATVGKNEKQLKEAKIEYDVYAKHFEHNDRALCDSNKGVYKIYTVKGKDKILGASLAGGPAGDIIGLIGNAMTNKIGLTQLG